MKTIPLTRSKVALVDDDDYERVSQYRWHATPFGRLWYAERTVQPTKAKVRMHRFILGATPGQEVDHVNRDGLDNRRVNLRFCTRRQNTFNVEPIQSRRGQLTASRFRGVTWQRAGRPWKVSVRDATGQVRYIGEFENELAAALAYDEAARELQGEFAYVNLIDSSEIKAARSALAQEMGRRKGAPA